MTITFVQSLNGSTKIFSDSTELETMLDVKAMRAFHAAKAKLPPVMGQQILDTISKKLANDRVNLSQADAAVVINYAKKELGL